jgi:hypothetical protein
LELRGLGKLAGGPLPATRVFLLEGALILLEHPIVEKRDELGLQALQPGAAADCTLQPERMNLQTEGGLVSVALGEVERGGAFLDLERSRGGALIIGEVRERKKLFVHVGHGYPFLGCFIILAD